MLDEVHRDRQAIASFKPFVPLLPQNGCINRQHLGGHSLLYLAISLSDTSTRHDSADGACGAVFGLRESSDGPAAPTGDHAQVLPLYVASVLLLYALPPSDRVAGTYSWGQRPWPLMYHYVLSLPNPLVSA